MPWCDSCDVYLAPNSVDADGTCPTCHHEVDNGDKGAESSASVPWHFWIVLVALVAYLGWRLVQGIIWVSHRL